MVQFHELLHEEQLHYEKFLHQEHQREHLELQQIIMTPFILDKDQHKTELDELL